VPHTSANNMCLAVKQTKTCCGTKHSWVLLAHVGILSEPLK